MSVRRYFGTDGIRGRVGDARINPEVMQRLGMALGQVLQRDHQQESAPLVLIGRDTRLSGPMIEAALITGLQQVGVQVQCVGVLPTPAVAYVTSHWQASAGIMISASHNLYEDNGVKLFDAHGNKLPDAMELEIEQLMDECVNPGDECQSSLSKDHDQSSLATAAYHNFCCELFKQSGDDLSGLRVVIDCANGAASRVAPAVLGELGADVVSLADQPDGRNINDRCGATDVRMLQQAVVREGADIGIALDGDADRLIVVNCDGERIDGDQVLYILATNPPAGVVYSGVVGTLMSNAGLVAALEARGLDFARARVGDRYVLEALRERGWRLGGESSGHVIQLDYLSTGDGLLTALQVLQVMQRTGRALTELLAGLSMWEQVLLNVPIDRSVDPTKIDQEPAIVAAVSAVEEELGADGRVLLRASGTESCIRVMVEAREASVASALAARLAGVVQGLFQLQKL